MVLLLFGLAWAVQALVTFMYGGSLPPPVDPWWHERLPYYVIGFLWAASSFFSAIGAFTRTRQNDTFGFVAVSLMPMFLAASYGTGSVTRYLSHDPTGGLIGLLGFTLWGAISLALGIIAGWRETEGGDSD